MALHSTDPELIDRLYECAFVPELWPGVLEEMGRMAGARDAWFIVSDTKVRNWVATTDFAKATLRALCVGGLILRQERFIRFMRSSRCGFIGDLDVYTRDELDADPVYRFLLRPAGLGWCAATSFVLPTGEDFGLCFERKFSLGPVEPAAIELLDALRPHLARSALMSTRLHLERARVAADTLAVIGLPALALGAQGKVLAANHLTEALTGYFHWRSFDRISLLHLDSEDDPHWVYDFSRPYNTHDAFAEVPDHVFVLLDGTVVEPTTSTKKPEP